MYQYTFLAKKTAMLVLYLFFAGLVIVTSEGAAIDGESVVASRVQLSLQPSYMYSYRVYI